MIRMPALTLMLFLFFCKNGDAQKNVAKFDRFVSLRTNLLSIAEMDAGIMLGVGYQWNKRFSASLDPSIIFFNPYKNLNEDYYHPSGIKIRLDVRYHFNDLFIAPELHFKKVTTRKLTTFGINCIGRNCDFYKIDVYREVKTEAGASVKFGINLPLDNKNRWSFEFYGCILLVNFVSPHQQLVAHVGAKVFVVVITKNFKGKALHRR